jgi:hypothetical protein
MTSHELLDDGDNITGHAFSKELASKMGLSLQDVWVLARNNDPYSIGTPANIRDAEWFMGLWDRFDFSYGIHLRRIHYRMVSHGDILRPDGTTYENTDKCWSFLSSSSKYARTLGLVDPERFTDRRNPPPNEFASSETIDPTVMWTQTATGVSQRYWTGFRTHRFTYRNLKCGVTKVALVINPA